MHRTRLAGLAVLALSLAAAARADPLIDRPIVLAPGATQVGLRGDIAQWTGGSSFTDGSLTGFSLGAGADFGIAKGVELGFAADFPLAPNANFGSILGSITFLDHPRSALRVDVGYERLSSTDVATDNGMVIGTDTAYTGRLFFGLGAPSKWRLAPMFALVSGQAGALNFGQFTNVGANGGSIYDGASDLLSDGSDIVTVSIPLSSDQSTVVTFNLPIGLMFQPIPEFAITGRVGFVVALASGGPLTETETIEEIPLGIDFTVSPTPHLDFGATFQLVGAVAASGGGSPGYADYRYATLWLRWRV